MRARFQNGHRHRQRLMFMHPLLYERVVVKKSTHFFSVVVTWPETLPGPNLGSAQNSLTATPEEQRPKASNRLNIIITYDKIFTLESGPGDWQFWRGSPHRNRYLSKQSKKAGSRGPLSETVWKRGTAFLGWHDFLLFFPPSLTDERILVSSVSGTSTH